MNGMEECQTRSKRRFSSAQEKINLKPSKKNKAKTKVFKKKVEKNKSSQELSCNKCDENFREKFDLVAHKCPVSISSTNVKAKSQLNSNQSSVKKLCCQICNQTFNSPSQLENHKISCNAVINKTCICEGKIPFLSKYSLCDTCETIKYGSDYHLRSQPTKNVDVNVLESLFEKNDYKKANFPVLRSKEVSNYHNSPVYNEAKDHRSDIHIRKVFDKVAEKGKNSRSKKVPNLSNKKLSLLSEAKVLSSAEFSKQNLTDALINEPLKLSKRHDMLNKREVKNSKALTDKNVSKPQVLVTRHKKDLKNSMSGVKEPSLENNFSRMPNEVTKDTDKTDFHVTKEKLDLLNLVSNKRKMSSESNCSSVPDKVVKENTKKEHHVTRQKQKLLNPMSRKRKKSSESISLSVQEKVTREKNSKKKNPMEIKLDTLVDLLPDSQSGILVKLSGKYQNFKCIKCWKTFGSCRSGSIHIIICKASLKKTKSVVLENLLWLCTFCHSEFNSISHLLIHKKSCCYPSKSSSIGDNDSYGDSLTNLLVEKPVKCKECGFTCLSNITLEEHPCKKRQEKMPNCFVNLGIKCKFERDAKEVTYYTCQVCKKDFFEAYLLKVHMKKFHPKESDKTLKPMNLHIREDIHNIRNNNLSVFDRSKVPTNSPPTFFNQAASLSSRIVSDAGDPLFLPQSHSLNQPSILFNQPSLNQPSTFNQPSSFRQPSTFNQPSSFRQPSTFNQPSSFRQPPTSLNQPSQHPFRVPSTQPSISQYQVLLPDVNTPANTEEVNEMIGCNCPSKKDHIKSDLEDVKPCGDCLKRYSSNFFEEKCLNFASSKSDELQEPSLSSNPKPQQARSFLTPPMTPESSSSSPPTHQSPNPSCTQPKSTTSNEEVLSSESNVSHQEEHSEFNVSHQEESSDANVMVQKAPGQSFEVNQEIGKGTPVNEEANNVVDFTKLKFSWGENFDATDVFAFVKSEEDLEVLRYVCAQCFDAINKNDILNHCAQHDITGNVNILYTIEPSKENKN